MTIDADEVTRMTAMQLGRKGVRPDDRLVEDLDATSVDLVNLTVAIEDRYQIAIGEEDAATLRTVADVLSLVRRLSSS